MSFRVATLENQIVKDLNDGAYYQYLLGDGTIRGCEITTTGTTIYIATGLLMVRGRLVPNEENEVYTLSETRDGYIQLKMRLNLNKPSIDGEYFRPDLIEEYQTTQTFPALTQEDINGGGGLIYEIELGVFQLSGGSIVGTVRSLSSALPNYHKGFKTLWTGNVSLNGQIAIPDVKKHSEIILSTSAGTRYSVYKNVAGTAFVGGGSSSSAQTAMETNTTTLTIASSGNSLTVTGLTNIGHNASSNHSQNYVGTIRSVEVEYWEPLAEGGIT